MNFDAASGDCQACCISRPYGDPQYKVLLKGLLCIKLPLQLKSVDTVITLVTAFDIITMFSVLGVNIILTLTIGMILIIETAKLLFDRRLGQRKIRVPLFGLQQQPCCARR